MDAITYWVATSEAEIHFIDAILSAYDGLASVRREYRVEDGETFYKVFVAPGMENEFLEILSRLRERAVIHAVRRDEAGP